MLATPPATPPRARPHTSSCLISSCEGSGRPSLRYLSHGHSATTYCIAAASNSVVAMSFPGSSTLSENEGSFVKLPAWCAAPYPPSASCRKAAEHML